MQKASGAAHTPALSVSRLGHDRRGESALVGVRLRLRPERPCPERRAGSPPRTVRCSSRTPTPATTATFYKATAATTTTTILANKGESRNGACGAQRDIYGESVIINLWTPPFF